MITAGSGNNDDGFYSAKNQVSIVVTAFKDVKKLNRCLRALCNDFYSKKEIILVTYGIKPQEIDNDLRTVITKHITLSTDKGYAYQKNLGFKHADPNSKYVIFIDDDVEIFPHTIETLVSVLEKHEDIGLAQPLLITEDFRVDSIGAYIDYLGYSYVPLRGLDANSMIDRNKKRFYKVTYVASCVILRTKLFKNSPFQPYDDFFFFNYEDVDLALKTWLKGYKVVCIPSAIAIHRRGRTTSLGRAPAKFVYLNSRNKLLTLLSVYDSLLILKYIPLLFVFEFLKTILLLRKNTSHSIVSLLAIIWVIKNFKFVIRRRWIVRSLSKSKAFNPVIIKPHFRTLIYEFWRHYEQNAKNITYF